MTSFILKTRRKEAGLFGVFTLRPDTHYAYDPFDRFPFLSSYEKDVRSLIGHWILYYEPVSVRASRGYFAMAVVEDIVPDRLDPRLRYALIERGSYIDFAEPVPFRDADGIVDHGIRGAKGQPVGDYRKTVRGITAEDFKRIASRGLGFPFDDFTDESVPLPRHYESQRWLEEERERRHVRGSRAVRDAIFRQSVLRAYNYRCAIFGWRLSNGAGWFETEAAHIQAVRDAGPDVVSNGLALSRTAHSLFDNGMIILSDDYRISLSPDLQGADRIRPMLPKNGRLFLPRRLADHPHPLFLAQLRNRPPRAQPVLSQPY